MPWTSPKTWVTGDIVHRSDFHTFVRDQQREMAPAKVTTKGDMVIGTGSNAIDRFGVGTNRQLLRYASGATLGVKWAWDAVPAGLISPFTGACPSGWSEFTAARGFAVVGTPSGGTNAGTRGSALTDLQDKGHTHPGPSHFHTLSFDEGSTNTPAGEEITQSQTGATTGTTASTSSSGWLPYVQLTFCSKD